MKQLPIFLTINGAHCLIAGGGPVAARKASLLLQAGAHLQVVAPTKSEKMHEVLSSPAAQFSQREYHADDLQAMTLVIAATDDAEVNQQIAADAKQRGILCNVADDPDAGNFTLPSIVNRDPVCIAISSGGTSPVLSRLLKTRIEAFLPTGYSTLALLAGEFREEIKNKIHHIDVRRVFWEKILTSNIAELAISGRKTKARQAMKAAVENTNNNDGNTNTGEVYLVGAGPGNADLLTFRALRLIQQAEVILYDRLVSDSIMDLCPKEAEHIYVGKRRADHAMPQTNINQTLIDHAKAGKRVLRLKGGDPFIFGRGGEEIETLAEHNIPFQVVPGITAASGCASYAGIPLTHRDHAQSCTFITGHLKDGTINLDWKRLVGTDQTIICYMGLMGLPIICEKLIAHGLAGDTPAALVERGTTADQQVHTGTVSTLPKIISSRTVTAPTLIIIGSVVTLREKLDWFDQ